MVELTKQEAADGSVYDSLSIGRTYEVLGIEGDWLRLLNDNGEPVLYDPHCFHVVDSSEPGNWESVVEDDVRYAYPPQWGQPGYFEDWHDGVEDVRSAFAEQLRLWHPGSVRE